MAEWFYSKLGSQPNPGSCSRILSQPVEWLLLQTAFIYSLNICMLWNASFRTKKHKGKTVASKGLFANWSTGGKDIRLCSGFLSLCCGARSSWGHSWRSSCYLSFKSSFPLNSLAAFHKMPWSICFPWKSYNNLFPKIHPSRSSQLSSPQPHTRNSQPSLALVFWALFLIPIPSHPMILILVCTTWSC